MERHHRIGKGGDRYKGKSGAGIVYTDGKQILLLKRADGDHSGSWGLPGGTTEPGELPIDTAIRECREECGHGEEGSRFDQMNTKDGGFSWTSFFYAVQKPFSCRLSHEHSDWKWINLQELKKYDLHPKLKMVVPSYLARIKQKFGVGSFKEWLS